MLRLAIMSIFLVLAAVPILLAGEPGDLVEHYPEGEINWTRGWIEVEATCKAAKGQDRQKPDISMVTMECARNAAKHRLHDTLLALTIDADTSVKDFAGRGHLQAAELHAMIAQAQVIDPVLFYTDGSITLRLRLGIHQGLSQLILPEEIGHVESITQVIAPPELTAKGDEKGYTGLLIDARELVLQPALAPKITDETGTEVYGPTYISRNIAVQGGMLMYLRSTDQQTPIQRTGSNPLQVRGLRSTGANRSDIVISNNDAARIKGLPDLLPLLKEGRVAILYGGG